MGGMSYDRDVYSSGSNYSSSGFHASPLADATFKKSDIRDLDPELLPLNRTLQCHTKNSLIIALDVTGSMGDSAKLLYDKLPMLWGQLEQQGYLDDFSISFAAVGDCTCDGAPFQICDFAEGKKIDKWIEKLFLEGGGGGQQAESYETLAYYYANKTRFTHPTAEKPFFFIIGDEAPYPTVTAESIKQHFGGKAQGDVPTKEVFDQIREKFNFKHIHVPYGNSEFDKEIQHTWKKCIDDDLVKVSEPKAVVDVVLGTVAILSGKRTLEEYEQDMRARGQTEERIKNVLAALKGLQADKDDAPSPRKSGRGKSQRL
jgi:hypothetical protein